MIPFSSVDGTGRDKLLARLAELLVKEEAEEIEAAAAESVEEN